MEKLCNHIERLLACNDHAVVPGFGGFVVQSQPAKIVGTTLFPPCATISFNQLMHHTDGMLAIQISRESGISYRNATKVIQEEIDAFMSTLRKNKTLMLGRLGTFTLEGTSQLVFTPAKTMSFLPSNIGLHAISLQPKKVSNAREIVIRLSPQKIMKYAAILITIFALFFSPEINETTHMIQADFHKLNTVDLPEIIITPDTNQPERSISTQSKNRYNYQIVVAAFRMKEAASSYADQLKANDFPTSKINFSNNRYHVSVREFASLISAVNYMEELRSVHPDFPDAWVMKTPTYSKN